MPAPKRTPPTDVSAIAVRSLIGSAVSGPDSAAVDENEHANLQLNAVIEQCRGRRKLIQMSEKLVTVTEIQALQQIKESKAFKGRTLLGHDGKSGRVTTWKEFCEFALGRSVEHVDEDLRNVEKFGEALGEALFAVGLPYRKLRELRKVPNERLTALIEAANSGNAQSVRDVAERLLDDQRLEHRREVAEFEKRIEDQEGTLKARERLLSQKDAENNALKEAINRPFLPSADAIATNAVQASQMKEATMRFAGIHADRLALANIANDIFEKYPRTPLARWMRTCLEFDAASCADLCNSHKIDLNLDVLLKPAPYAQGVSQERSVDLHPVQARSAANGE